VRTLLDQPDGWLWLHFNLSDQRARRWLLHAAQLPATVRDLLLDTDNHLQIEVVGDTVAGVLADMHYDPHRDGKQLGRLRFALTQRLVISARAHPLRSVEATRQSLETGRRFKVAAELLEAIVDRFASTLQDVSTELSDTLNSIEDAVLDDMPHDERASLGSLRREAVRIHRQVKPLRALFLQLERSHGAKLPASVTAAATRLAQRLDALAHDVEAIQERARLLQDELDTKLAQETNRNLYALSVITALLLPPTLVTGIFGMNTGGLPLTKTDDGFLWAIAIGIGASVLAYWILRRVGVAAPGRHPPRK
jgi:zinc transporter